MKVLERDRLPLGGFGGLTEHRLVMDPRVFGPGKTPQSWAGLGHFVYLADARFQPKGETGMHPHREVDVISVMIEGRLAHEGTLEHGRMLDQHEVQVQRAGGEGFLHNEVNPDTEENRMLQLWVAPETLGEPAGYKTYAVEKGGIRRVYGGPADQSETYPARTTIDVGFLAANQEHRGSGPFLIYLFQGQALIDGKPVPENALVRSEDLGLKATSDLRFVLIQAA